QRRHPRPTVGQGRALEHLTRLRPARGCSRALGGFRWWGGPLFGLLGVMDERAFATDGAGLLPGRTVLVTGASSGIGEAAARLFAQEGAAVVLMARREERLTALAQEIEASGGQVAISAGDVTRADDVERAVAVAVDRFGGLNGAFNNAGYAGSVFGKTHELP